MTDGRTDTVSPQSIPKKEYKNSAQKFTQSEELILSVTESFGFAIAGVNFCCFLANDALAVSQNTLRGQSVTVTGSFMSTSKSLVSVIPPLPHMCLP